MGTPLDENVPANSCPLCFGASGPLGLVQPTYIDVRIFDVVPGPNADLLVNGLPNGTWRLKLTNGCLYEYFTADQQVTVQWTVNNTLVRHRDSSSIITFNAAANSIICGTALDSQITASAFSACYGGSAEITWPLGGLE